jgi:hypothetical protein
MEFTDKEIIEKRRLEQRLEELNIYGGGIPVGQYMYSFTRREFYNGKISMVIPEEFVDLPPEKAKIKYPSENRAELILSSPDEDTDITFSIIDTFTNECNLGEYAGSFRAVIKRLHPTAVLSSVQKVKIASGKGVFFFTYELATLERIILGYTFMFDVGGKLLYGGFSCPIEQKMEWKILFPQILKSVIIKGGTDQDAGS